MRNKLKQKRGFLPAGLLSGVHPPTPPRLEPSLSLEDRGRNLFALCISQSVVFLCSFYVASLCLRAEGRWWMMKQSLMKVHSLRREEGGGGRWAGGQMCIAVAEETCATKTR